jgi:putative ABC transport system permease protein
LLVGASAAAQFAGLEIGSPVRLQDGDWTVVGTFAGGDGSRESEIIADVQTVMSAYKFTSFNSLVVGLESPGSFVLFKDTLAADKRLAVDTYTEPEYLSFASSDVNRILKVVAYAIGSIMALGALFGALNSMHAAVVSRGAEIATLRAIGFSSTAVAVAVLTEALLLAFVGAATGVGISYAVFDGARISTLGGALFDSQLVYALTFTPTLVLSVVALACSVGLLGAVLPALRAARVNIAEALHET